MELCIDKLNQNTSKTFAIRENNNLTSISYAIIKFSQQINAYVKNWTWYDFLHVCLDKIIQFGLNMLNTNLLKIKIHYSTIWKAKMTNNSANINSLLVLKKINNFFKYNVY
jgi:hypothetical protein